MAYLLVTVFVFTAIIPFLFISAPVAKDLEYPLLGQEVVGSVPGRSIPMALKCSS